MPQISKYKLNQQVYRKIFALFPDFLARLARQGQQQVVINTLFSATERIMLAKRLAIALMLVKGYSYQEIVHKLKVSWGTVGKISELLKTSDQTFVKELEQIAKQEAFADFLLAIGYKISSTLPPRGGNWSVWRRRIEAERKKEQQPF